METYQGEGNITYSMGNLQKIGLVALALSLTLGCTVPALSSIPGMQADQTPIPTPDDGGQAPPASGGQAATATPTLEALAAPTTQYVCCPTETPTQAPCAPAPQVVENPFPSGDAMDYTFQVCLDGQNIIGFLDAQTGAWRHVMPEFGRFLDQGYDDMEAKVAGVSPNECFYAPRPVSTQASHRLWIGDVQKCEGGYVNIWFSSRDAGIEVLLRDRYIPVCKTPGEREPGPRATPVDPGRTPRNPTPCPEC